MVPTDSNTTIEKLKMLTKDFCDSRGWDQGGASAKDIAIAIITESSELLEHFRFVSEHDVQRLMLTKQYKDEVIEELCDVLFGVLRFAQLYNIDLMSSLQTKMKKYAIKYPSKE